MRRAYRSASARSCVTIMIVMPERFIELANEVHDLGSGVAVEIAGGFIGQQQLG